MKLVKRIILRSSLVLIVVLSIWAILFYAAMMNEVTDEIDDSLDLYTEMVITRLLAGKEIPNADNGTNNSYYLRSVSREYADTHSHRSFTDEMLYIEAKRETEPARVMRTIFQRADGSYNELIVMTPTIEKQDLREAIAYWVMGLYLVIIFTIIIVNRWIVSKSMKPLYSLLHWLDRYNIDEQTPPLDNPTKVTEFRKLNDTIVRFSQRNRELFEQQKRFIGDASHELQTPLAICQSRLEMLCDTELTEEQMGEVLKTLQTLDHLSELNRSLLFLSKIDNKQFPETTDVDVLSLVEETQREYQRIAVKKGVEVKVEKQKLSQGFAPGNIGLSAWHMNPSLAKALIENLLRNAIVHNIEGGVVEIYVSKEKLTIANTGEDGALNSEHIFDRFYKTRGKEGSTGLGLAIVSAICHLYNLKVSYEYHDNKHYFMVEH